MTGLSDAIVLGFQVTLVGVLVGCVVLGVLYVLSIYPRYLLGYYEPEPIHDDALEGSRNIWILIAIIVGALTLFTLVGYATTWVMGYI